MVPSEPSQRSRSQLAVLIALMLACVSAALPGAFVSGLMFQPTISPSGDANTASPSSMPMPTLKGLRSVPAGLWADPFAGMAVPPPNEKKTEEQSKAAGPANTANEASGAGGEGHDDFHTEINRTEDLSLVVVLVPGESTAAEIQDRTNYRHAVELALVKAEYQMDYPDRMSFFTVNWRVTKGSAVLNHQSEMPVKLYSKTDPKDPILVCWIDRRMLGDKPLDSIHHALSKIVDRPKEKTVTVVGPNLSSELARLDEEVSRGQAGEWRKWRIVSPFATSAKIRTNFMKTCGKKGLRFQATIGTDDKIVNALVNEMKLRRLERGRIVVLYEAGATSPGNLKTALVDALGGVKDTKPAAGDQQIEDAPVGDSGGAGDPKPQKHDKEILEFDYLKGVGAVKGDGVSRVDDYFLRKVNSVVQGGSTISPAGVSAVIVLGDDVTDKLSLIRIARQTFPNATLLTHQMHHMYFAPTSLLYCRGLIVASHGGLVGTAAGDPEFRDVYQRSLYDAMLLAVDTKRLAQEPPLPSVYEIAATVPVDVGRGWDLAMAIKLFLMVLVGILGCLFVAKAADGFHVRQLPESDRDSARSPESKDELRKKCLSQLAGLVEQKKTGSATFATLQARLHELVGGLWRNQARWSVLREWVSTYYLELSMTLLVTCFAIWIGTGSGLYSHGLYSDSVVRFGAELLIISVTSGMLDKLLISIGIESARKRAVRDCRFVSRELRQTSESNLPQDRPAAGQPPKRWWSSTCQSIVRICRLSSPVVFVMAVPVVYVVLRLCGYWASHNVALSQAGAESTGPTRWSNIMTFAFIVAAGCALTAVKWLVFTQASWGEGEVKPQSQDGSAATGTESHVTLVTPHDAIVKIYDKHLNAVERVLLIDDCTRISLVVAPGLYLLWRSASGWLESRPVGIEPIDVFSGISIWPSLVMLAAVIYFCFSWLKKFGDGRIAWPMKRNEVAVMFPYKPNAFSEETPRRSTSDRGELKVQELERIIVQQTRRDRDREPGILSTARFMVWGLLFCVFAWQVRIEEIQRGQFWSLLPLPPARGDLGILFGVVLSTLALLLCLTVSVIAWYQYHVFRRFARCVRHAWRPVYDGKVVEVDGFRHMDAIESLYWVCDFLQDGTYWLARNALWQPSMILLLFAIARSPMFETWQVNSETIILVAGVPVFLGLLSSFMLRTECLRMRSMACRIMADWVVDPGIAYDDESRQIPPDEVGRIREFADKTRVSIERMNQGAFASLSNDPVIGSILALATAMISGPGRGVVDFFFRRFG